MDARFVGGPDGASLTDAARQADAEGVAAVIVRPGALGDPVVLASGLSSAVPRALLGAQVALGADGRHPALVAREFTSFDHVCGGRSLLCCLPPFDDTLAEALALCRAMWREGHAVSDGPAFPVPGARHRPRPAGPASPLVALDLTGAVAGGGGGGGQSAGAETGPVRAPVSVPEAVAALADFVVHPTDDPATGRMERP